MAYLFKARSLVALLVALAFMVGSIIAVADLYRTQSQDRDHAKDTIGTQLALAQVLSLLQDAETGQRGFLLTGSETYLQPFSEATTALSQALESLGARVSATTAQAQAFGELQSLSRQKLAELQRTIILKQQGKDSDALAVVNSNQGKELMDRTRFIIGQLQNDQSAMLLAANQAVDRDQLLTEIGIAVALALAMVLAVFVLMDAKEP